MAVACPLAFDAEQHLYRLRGVPVPSVTQVLRQTGYITFEGVPMAILEKARARGQRVHEALHFLLEDDLDDSSIDTEVSGYLQSGKLYLDAQVEQVYRAEMKVWSERHACAGTLDLIALHTDGYLSVSDFKTGHPDDVSADLQTGGYAGFLLEMGASDQELGTLLRSTKRPLLRRRSIRLFKDGRIARETLYPDTRDYARFLNALSVVHDQGKRPAPLVAWDDER